MIGLKSDINRIFFFLIYQVAHVQMALHQCYLASRLLLEHFNRSLDKRIRVLRQSRPFQILQ